jgi:hypothetical protein
VVVMRCVDMAAVNVWPGPASANAAYCDAIDAGLLLGCWIILCNTHSSQHWYKACCCGELPVVNVHAAGHHLSAIAS